MGKQDKSVKSEPVKKNTEFPTLELKTSRDIAMDFAEKVYQKFNTLVKSVILFGSTAKDTAVVGSDIDIVIVVDDASFKFDEKFILWYREELGKIIQGNPYKKDLHINTVKITTWWEDLMSGDPTVINIIRYGEVLIDNGGFFSPLKFLLLDGKIKTTPEAIYVLMNRVPAHILRSRVAEMSAIEGCYWAFVECAQSLLMVMKVVPPSPEHIPELLQTHFVEKGLLKKQVLKDFVSVYDLHKKIIHGEVRKVDGRIIDEFQKKAEDFFDKTVKIFRVVVRSIILWSSLP